MKKLTLLLILITTINYSCNHLKLAYNAISNNKCEKAKKHLEKIPIETIKDFPITYNLIKAKLWECPANNNDSSCFYFFKVYALIDVISEEEKYFLSKRNVDKQSILDEIEKKKCKLATEKFLDYFEKNKIDDCILSMQANDSLNFYLNLGRKQSDSLIAPACFALCKGINHELLNHRKEACTYYSCFFDDSNRSSYDLYIIENKRNLLNNDFLKHRKNVCKYFCQIAIDYLKNKDCDNDCIKAYINFSEKNNDTTKFPLTTLYAKGLYSQICLKDDNKTCYYFGQILSMITNPPKDSLFLNVYKKDVYRSINELKKINCYDTIKVHCEVPLKDVTKSLEMFKKKVNETCKVNYRNKIFQPLLQVDYIDSLSIRIGLVFNGDVWSYYDSLALGVYKSDVVENLLKNAMFTLQDFLGTFDKVNLETYILGLADGTPIKNNIQYDGVFGQPITKAYSVSDEIMVKNKTWYKTYKNLNHSNITNKKTINDVELALLRGICAENIINNSLKVKGYDVNSKLFVYDYPDIKENEKAEYRRIEIVFIMRNVLNDIKNNLDKAMKIANTWNMLLDEENKKLEKK